MLTWCLHASCSHKVQYTNTCPHTSWSTPCFSPRLTRSRLTCTAYVSPRPASTNADAVIQARGALRRYREAVAAGQVSLPDTGPGKVRIDLPWPVRSAGDDGIRLLDEGQWPGGVTQRFRALRPSIEMLLEGYSDLSFAGMLESEADGVGVWSMSDMTAVVNVTNATMRPFVDLAEGKYGARVTQAGHMLLAVNCQWTESKDVGQLWDGKLRAQTATLIDDKDAWTTVYTLKPVYTSKGRCGIVFCAYPGPWQLFSIAAEGAYVPGEAVLAGELLLSGDTMFAREAIVEALAG